MKLNIGAIILAAGASSRMGEPKQLLLWKKKTFIEHVVETAIEAKLSPIIVVLGAHAEKIIPILEKYNIKIVINHDWKAGLSTSIKTGIIHYSPINDGTVVLLADQPQIPFSLIKSLIDKKATSNAWIIYPERNGKRGNPILLSKEVFPHVNNLKGDQGMRQILKKFKKDSINWQDDSIFFDVDQKEDFETLKSDFEFKDKKTNQS